MTDADVIIVGAGPSGLSAATELCRRGVARVLVLDREPAPGGIPRHCGHSPYGLREYRRLMSGPAYARRLAADAIRAGATVLTGVTVTALHPAGRISVTTDKGTRDMAARVVLLAMGARETPRAPRLIGGTKPGGILNTGALQGLAYLEGKRPFARPLILGTELVAFSALLTCRHIGARPVGMVEPDPRPTVGWPSTLLPWSLRVPLWTGTDLAAVEGHSSVTAAILTRNSQSWRVPCDGIVVTGKFRPESALLATSHLARDPRSGGPVIDAYGRCSDSSYFATGNLLRAVETAGWCWAEGRATAAAISRALTGTLPDPAPPITLTGDALKYVVPQRPTPAPAHDRLNLRLTRPAHGRLRLLVDGAEVASRTLSSGPERRITLPAPPPGTQVEIIFEET